MRLAAAPEIAIVGMGCRFPQARGIEAYWRLLEGNVDAVSLIPGDRFDIAEHCVSDASGILEPGKSVSRYGGFLDDLYRFDAGFFGISAREAATMDPQQRLLLQVAWEALEDAGIRPSGLAGTRTGVFVGQATAEYADVSPAAAAKDVRAMVGSRLRAATAGRLSFALDLHGPSLVLDTACSSSLVAVHTARQSLLTSESDLAIAAGVNVVLSPDDAIAYSQGGMLAPDGRCKFGDSSADGFVRSEGIGVVLLKRLPDALRDGDRVLGLLLGSAVNNDGRGSGLLLQPAVSGQVEMVREACRTAGISPSQLDYVEAHGTGTTVGDGVELRALAEAIAGERSAENPLPVGSVKSNIGHAEAAAGMAGLIKAVLTARRRLIPASLHLGQPHPLLEEGGLPLRVVNRNTVLEPAADTALLGVSSFGISGTNAHVVVGEYREPAAEAPAPPARLTGRPELLVLSARTPAALRLLALDYADYLGPSGAGRKFGLPDICHTAALGRDAHPYRMWAAGADHDALAATLRALGHGEDDPHGGIADTGFGGDRKTAFVFPGQGSQWLGMGRELLESSAVFQESMTECDAAVREELGWSVLDVLTADTGEFPDSVAVVQPVLWAMEVSLAALLRESGLEPDLCLGHSMGESAAAYVAGALSLRDAAAVICRRSTLMQRQAGRGAMLAVELPADEAGRVAARFGDEVCVAAENAPEATVLAGDPGTLDEIAAFLKEREVFCRRVKVNIASHSPHMDELRDALTASLAGLTPTTPRTGMFSTTRCAPVTADTPLDADYWTDNLRKPVRFVESVRTVLKEDDLVFVEVSPHPLLVQALLDTQQHVGKEPAATATLVRRQSELTALARVTGNVFAHGGTVDWSRWFARTGRRGEFVDLPTYHWDEEEFLPDRSPDRSPGRSPGNSPARTRETGYERRLHPHRLGLDELGGGVRVRGLSMVPPAVHFGAVAETARDLGDSGNVLLEDITFTGPPLELATLRETSGALRVRLDPLDPLFPADPTDPVDPLDPAGPLARLGSAPGSFRFRTDTSVPGRAQAPGIAGTVRVGREAVRDARDASYGQELLDSALTRCTEYVPAAEFQRRAQARGFDVDPALRTVAQVWRRDGEAVARLSAARLRGPGALEAGLLPMLAAWPHSTTGSGATGAYLPVSFDSVRFTGELADGRWSVARFAAAGEGGDARCDVVVLAADGRVLLEVTGMALRGLSSHEDRLPASAPTAASASASSPASVSTPASPSASASAFVPHPGVPTPVPDRPELPAESDAPRRTPMELVAGVLGTSAERLDPRRPLRDLGLDSLMAGQLRLRLRNSYGVDIPVGRLLGAEGVANVLGPLFDQRR
ncbi:acyltransferase domain-containing protein [Streptomyces sp. NPDC048442]|uniref:type I polyketide synthase n=1 Tax=Streptomyces sp. NPDC048442 TaxID=3154823 RepID=UPI003446F48E